MGGGGGEGGGGGGGGGAAVNGVLITRRSAETIRLPSVAVAAEVAAEKEHWRTWGLSRVNRVLRSTARPVYLRVARRCNGSRTFKRLRLCQTASNEAPLDTPTDLDELPSLAAAVSGE